MRVKFQLSTIPPAAPDFKEIAIRHLHFLVRERRVGGGGGVIERGRLVEMLTSL